MRVYSSLLGAAIVLVACVNASSTKSDSTIVTSTPPNQDDVPPQRNLRGSDEIDKEERNVIEELANGFHLEPKIQENKINSELMENEKSVEDAFDLLDKSQLQLNGWVRHAAAKKFTAFSDEMIEKVQKIYGLSGLAKVLEAYGTAKDAEGLITRLETKLTESWTKENTPMKEALGHLGLDKPTDSLVRKRLLKRWVEYGKTKENPDSAMLEAINGCNDEIRYAAFEGLREIKGTDRVVKDAFSSLMTSLEKKTLDVNIAFKLLKLDQPGDTQSRTLHFDEWVKYAAAKKFTAFSDEVIENVHKNYGLSVFVTMLKAFETIEGARRVAHTFETKLIESWTKENTPMKEALGHLGLDKPTDSLVRKRLLKRWVEYGKTKENPDSAMLEAINGCNDEIRYAAFEGLREIKGTDRVVKDAFSSLMTSLETKTLDVNIAFKLLKLDQPGDTQSRTLHFDEWVKYAAKTPASLFR